MKDIIILIPTLNPDQRLINLVHELKNIGICQILIVNDGSLPTNRHIFTKLEKLNCTILHHRTNLGKGQSIKTGINYLLKNIQNTIGIVTADDDGQHTPLDIQNIAAKLQNSDQIILGEREFDNKKMPLTSKIGNTFSSIYFWLTTGQKLKDTQTGLRGIPQKYFSFALDVPGHRYEYEMRFLEAMYEQNVPYQTVTIQTVYDKNWSTHFQFISDSYNIYPKFFRNVLSSLSSAILDILFFMILVNFTNIILISNIIARLLSGIYNFILNKTWTFEKKDSHNTTTELKRYLILFIVQMFVSSITTNWLNATFQASTFGLLIIKIIVDLLIFTTNFIIQRQWIFHQKSTYKKSI